VNVSRFTSPADEIAAKAVKRIAEARIVSRVTGMNVTAPEQEVGTIPLIVLSPQCTVQHQWHHSATDGLAE